MNQHDQPSMDQMYDLLEALLEGTLSDEQARDLEQRVLTDPASKRLYVEYLHQHAGLRWHRGATTAALDAGLDAPAAPIRFRVLKYAAAAALVLFIGVWLGSDVLRLNRAAPFATLLEVRGGKWGSTTLPTEPGSRLAAGRLRLDDGIATIRFDSGVQLTIEGASDLELVRKDRCVLHAGGLVANVPHNAIGFVVDTPKARVIDHGTSFGVSVDDKGEGRVQVFEGIVDVLHAGDDKAQRLTDHGAVRIGDTKLHAAAEPEDEGRVGRTEQSLLPAADSLRITTAAGRGRDAYIKNPRTTMHDSDVLLLIKQGGPRGMTRKAYLAFDIASLKGRRVRDAHLQLTMVPTGWGFASGLPDCDFDVYGLTDESADNWQPDSLDWSTAPGNLDDDTGIAADPARTRLIGTFRVPSGTQQGLVEISGQPLADFLTADTNGIVTFILVRRTIEVRAGSLVHGFASSRHPTAAPPTLRVATE